MEGENDFSGKRYVWLRDPEKAFIRGLVLEEREGGMLLVQCDDGSVRTRGTQESGIYADGYSYSNAKSMQSMSTRLTPQSSTRRMIWPSSPT